MPAGWRRKSASAACWSPPGAGVGSAIGFLRAPVGYEVVRSLYQRFSTFDVAAVNDLLDDMRQEAEAAVAKGSFGAPTVETRTAYMRYVGQGHEIPVPLPNRVLGAEDMALIRAPLRRGIRAVFRSPGAGIGCRDHELRCRRYDCNGRRRGRRRERMHRVPTEAMPVRTQLVRDTTTGAVSPMGDLRPRIAGAGCNHRGAGDRGGG